MYLAGRSVYKKNRLTVLKQIRISKCLEKCNAFVVKDSILILIRICLLIKPDFINRYVPLKGSIGKLDKPDNLAFSLPGSCFFNNGVKRWDIP